MDNDTEEMVEEQAKPGAYLAYERQKRGITLQEVADTLHLSVAMLEALEADAYDQLPEIVYVRGYIRSYCRFLEIEATAVLDMHSSSLPEEEEEVFEDLYPTSLVNEKLQRLTLVWGSVAVVSLIVGLLFFNWWQTHQPPFLSLSHVEHNPKVIATASEQNVSSVKQSNESPDSSILAPVDLGLTPAKSDDSTINIDMVYKAPPVSSESDTSRVEQNETVGIGEMPELFSMMISARGESWARIIDGSGEVIVHRVLPAGYGKAFVVSFPVTIELGNAHQVGIMFEGAEYDMSPHIKRNNIAFFKVTELP